MQSIKIELDPGGIIPVCYASRDDNGREIQLILTKNDILYPLTGEETLYVNVRRPDRQTIISRIQNPGGAKFIFTISSEISAVPGKCLCGLQIIVPNEFTKGTTNFILEVEDL